MDRTSLARRTVGLGRATAQRPGGRRQLSWPPSPWNLTFDDIVEETEFSDSRRAPVAIDDRGELTCERLHPRIANWNCRPEADIEYQQERSVAERSHRAAHLEPADAWCAAHAATISWCSGILFRKLWRSVSSVMVEAIACRFAKAPTSTLAARESPTLDRTR